jgi:hypothetical protein
MSEVKPGACPACGGSAALPAGWSGSMYAVECQDDDCMSGPYRRTEAEAVAAWNGIRARVLREAAEIASAEIMADPDDPVLIRPTGTRIFVALHQAADRAEQGES